MSDHDDAIEGLSYIPEKLQQVVDRVNWQMEQYGTVMSKGSQVGAARYFNMTMEKDVIAEMLGWESDAMLSLFPRTDKKYGDTAARRQTVKLLSQMAIDIDSRLPSAGRTMAFVKLLELQQLLLNEDNVPRVSSEVENKPSDEPN